MRSRPRILRTFGFDSPANLVLTREQATGFRAQMAQLNDTQLAVEMYGRVVEARRSLFDPNTESLQQELARVSQYLRRVLLEWETDSTVVGPFADASAPSAGSTSASSSATTMSRARPSAPASQSRSRIELLLLGSGSPPMLTDPPDAHADEVVPSQSRRRRSSSGFAPASPEPIPVVLLPGLEYAARLATPRQLCGPLAG